VCTSAKRFPVLGNISNEGKENVDGKNYGIAAPHSADSFHRPNATGTLCTVWQYFALVFCLHGDPRKFANRN